MKKLLTLLIILISLNGLGQSIYPTPYNQQGSPSTLVQVRGGWKADSTAMMPKYVDTITANLYKTKLYAGSIIFTTGDGNYWYRSADAARWLLFGNSVTNCLGTQLISGSITWSGSGLIFDATDLDYSIICTRYSSSATTLTLSTADPTYARIDKLYADITGNVGVITGTPAPNPQEPVINPLSQLDMGIVYIPAGSTVPAGTTQTIIYNENVEFIGTSDVPSINFAYATNPYIGSLSTYLPSAPNSSYVEWQSNGIDYLFSDAQYLKFWVRLNADFTVDPLSFLDVTFEYTDVTVSQTLAVGNGDYNMDYSLINQWQLVSIPLTGITTFGTDFNSVHFVINSAPTSFQLDYVYLLETATVPPVISSGWSLNLNTGTNPTTNGIGTSDSVGVAIKTNSQTRLIVPANGIVELSNDELDQQLLTIRNDTIYKTNIPTAYGTLPIVVEVRNDSTFITCPTCDTTGGGGSQNLFQVTHVGNSTDTSIVINGDVPDNGGILYFDNAVNGNTYLNSSAIGSGTLNSYLGWLAGDGSTGDINTFVGAEAGGSNNGSRNTFVGEGAGVGNDGSLNTFLGENTGAFSVGDSNVFLGNRMGYNNTGSANILIGVTNLPSIPNTHRNVIVLGNGENLASADSQFVIAPYVGKMFLDLDSASGTAPAIAGIDANGNWRKYATPSGGSPALTSTYVGVGNVSNVLSGSANFTEDGSILTYNGAGGVSIPNGGLSVAGGTISAIDYTGDWTGSVINPLYGGTGVNNGSNTITLGGNLTTSGAFASTFTMTAATGVTFPTTGTLATLAGSETFTNKTITSPTLSGTLIGSGTIGGSTTINTAGSITGFNIVATGLMRAAAASTIEWNGRTKLSSTTDGAFKVSTNAGTSNFSIGATGAITVPTTVTTAGTTGAVTINKPSGTVNIAAAGTSVVVTNSLVSANSIVYAVIRTNDATARIANVVPASGSFTINIVACTAEVSIGFFVIN